MTELIKKKYLIYAHLFAIELIAQNLIWREKYENVELLYVSCIKRFRAFFNNIFL